MGPGENMRISIVFVFTVAFRKCCATHVPVWPVGLQGTEGRACSLYYWYHTDKGIHKSLLLSLAAGFRHQATEQSMTVIPGMYGVHCKHSSSIQPLISNKPLALLGYGSMCSGTLGHIARYQNKTSNNNKMLMLDVLYLDFVVSCPSIHVSRYPLYCSIFFIHAT